MMSPSFDEPRKADQVAVTSMGPEVGSNPRLSTKLRFYPLDINRMSTAIPPSGSTTFPCIREPLLADLTLTISSIHGLFMSLILEVPYPTRMPKVPFQDLAT